MQNVSDKWLAMQDEIMQDECYVEVNVEFSDTDSSYTATANEELVYLSDAESILNDDTTYKYGTLEKNIWLLDGSVLWSAEENDKAGYIGTHIADEDGYINGSTVLSIYPETASENLYAITITWSETFEEYAENFTVTCYYHGTETAQEVIEGNQSTVSAVILQAENYDEIRIAVQKWCLPYRRVRIENILIGYKQRFGKNELFKFSIEENVNPLNAVLPENTLDFSIDYTKENDTTIQKYFRRGQRINAYVGMDVRGGKEMISGGIYYLDEWDFEKGGIRGNFTAKSVIYFLNQIIYDEGKYVSEKVSLHQLASNVLNFAKEHSGYKFTWVLSSHLTKIMTSAPLPVCSVSECLQLIAQAGGCTLICGRDNKIKILKTSYSNVTQKYPVKELVLLDYPKAELQTELSRIKANIYSYTTKAQEVLYHDIHYIDGTAEIVIQHAMSANVSGTVTPYLSSEEIEIVSESYFAERSKLKITGTGYAVIEITGNPLETSSAIYSATISSTGSEETIDNPLIIEPSNAKLACETAISWIQNNTQETFTCRADPRLDAGDFVKYHDDDILVHHLKYNFTGMFRGEITGRIGYSDFVLPDENEADLIDDEIWPDVNGDGLADARDAAIIKQAAADIGAGIDPGLTVAQEVKADADRNGEIKAIDGTLVEIFATQVGIGDYEQSPSDWVRFLKNNGYLT